MHVQALTAGIFACPLARDQVSTQEFTMGLFTVMILQRAIPLAIPIQQIRWHVLQPLAGI